jgi:superfamily II DNA or RNA helicase
VQLRPYQQGLLDEARAHLKAGVKSILLQLPTGGGKTVITATMLGRAAAKGHRCAFGVHRRELVKQSIATFNEVGIPHGVVSAGWYMDGGPRVQICSVPTWLRRTKYLGKFQLIVWDECHHIAAGSWDELHRQYPEAVHIGLTATPERLDGRGLGDWFDVMVNGPTLRELIQQGFLSPYRLFSKPSVDMAGAAVSGGEYRREDVVRMLDQSTILGDAVEHYQKHAAGRRAVAFEASIDRSRALVEKFRAAGIAAEHLDGGDSAAHRDQVLADFEAGRVRVVSNVDLFGEGFDLPSLECVIMNRPTHSLGLYLQQVGRGLRIYPGKQDCVILDHAGNFDRHGAPDEPRRWTLKGRKPAQGGAGEEKAPVGPVCTACFAISPPGSAVCVECGTEFPPRRRELRMVDGQLVEVEVGPRDDQAARDFAEYARARARAEMFPDFQALVREGRRRKLRNPEGWAMHVLEGRQRAKA